MRRLSLSTLLIAVGAGIVLVSVLSVAWAAVRMLERLADQQALDRARGAAAAAARSIEQEATEISTAAHLLSERPTLHRLALAGDARSLSAFLDQFARTGRFDACAVVSGGSPIAQGGWEAPWPEILAARAKGADRFLERLPGGILIAGASSIPPEVPSAEVIVLRRVDRDFAKALSERIGFRVSIVDRADVESGRSGPRAVVEDQALSSEEAASARLGGAGLYVAATPLRAPSGEILGVVETTLSTRSVEASVRRLVRALGALTLVVLAAATLISFLVGRRIGKPVESLTEAAARIGRGDLLTPIPRAPGAEVGTLSTAMEEMRGRLLHLTAELRQRRAEAEAILTGIMEGVYTVDRERRIRYMNPQAARLLGIDPKEAIGKFCGDVLQPRGPGGVRPCEEQCPIVHARFRGAARATEEIAPAGGPRRTVVIASAPPAASQESGDLRQFQLLRDETETEATRRLRDTVLANVSHEFKTPLSAQLASIELLRERLPEEGAEEMRTLIGSLERGTLRLTQLVDNLLESVRIDAGEDSIRRRPLHLDEVVEEAVEMASPIIAQREQTLEVDLPYPLPPIVGDRQRLTQVMVNLLGNASKFAPPSTAIRIGGSSGDGAVTLWVEDEGPGLPPEAGASIFNRFYRAPGEEPEESGMGLGLWIVKSIVERHGGSVAATGAAGRTRVSVTLPSQGEESGASPPGDGRRPAGGRSARE